MWSLVSLLGLLLGGAADDVVPAASPTPAPASCADGGRKERAHETGRRQGRSMVESAWASVRRDCREQARIDQSVRDALARRVVPAEASETWKCRNTGLEAGANDALAYIAAECTGK